MPKVPKRVKAGIRNQIKVFFVKGVKVLEREIKFRGYSKEYGGWLFSHRLFTNMEEGPNKGKTFLNVTDYIDDWEEVECLGEFTGLQDKNGKEIYEGDIFHYEETSDDDGYILDNEEYVKVAWVDECGGFYIVNQNEEPYCILGEALEDCLEIVGNIYENKDLID